MNRQFASNSLGNRTVGNYVIGKNLGQGTFGKVKLGTHSLTGEKVAIKILEKSKITTAADVERVSRQIHILKMVRHPHIIQLYEIIETSKQLFLVMEYVSDGQLFDYIVKRRKLKETEACQFFRQLLAGVDYLHQIGVVHRDLKPENLLIDFNRRLKLVDFGLSNTYETNKLLKTACGSPCYAAPEMIAGKKYAGLASDIWSCGIILFAMICGYLPFEDPNTGVLYKKIMAGEFTIPKGVSQSGRQLLTGMLNVNPQERFTLKQIKNHSWYKQLGQESPTYTNGIIVGQHLVPVDQDILNSLVQYKQDVDQLRRYVRGNRHNHPATMYYLLLKKSFKIGNNSIYDICSPNFDRKLLQLPSKELYNQTTNQTLQNDARGTTAVGPRNLSSSSRTGRISNFSQNNYINKRKQDSIQLKLDMDNLPIVDFSNKKKRLQIHSIHRPNPVLNATMRVNNHMVQTPIESARESRQSGQKSPTNPINIMNTTLYDIQEFTSFNTNNKKRPPTTFRNSVGLRNTINIRNHKKVEQQFSDRYQSLDNSEDKPTDKQLMTRTFMGSIPKGYIPRWENQSERIRSILNTTISGHSKKRAHKFAAYF